MSTPPPVEGDSSHFFTTEIARTCAEEIHQAGGVEVFFIGRRGEDGLVREVESHAFGTENCVPALTHLADPGDVIIHNHPSGHLLPSSADLAIAAPMGNLGVGFYIIDNECTRCRVVVKAEVPRKKVPVEEGEITRRLSTEGNLARVVNDFEDRPQQRQMSLAVARALNKDGIVVVEAGTGTGKSLAYLLPSVLFSMKNKDRLVISTNTINLQEQLLHKDIPALRQAMGLEDFDVEIVKGRSNYVCRRKAGFASVEADTLLEDDFIRELKQVLNWIDTSDTGDRQDLPFITRDEVWERVQSESDNCLRLKCPFYEKCFFYNSRRRAARARLLIVNHSLLMSDLAVRRETGNYTMAAVLPPYSRVILDEAHHLEEVATRNLARIVSRSGIRHLLSRIYRSEKGGNQKGVLVTLRQELEGLVKRGRIGALDPFINDLVGQVMPRIGDIRESLEVALQEFGHVFLQAARLSPPRVGQEHKIRITPILEREMAWEEDCLRILAECAEELGSFVDLCEKTRELLEEWEDHNLEAITDPLLEWQAYTSRIKVLRQTFLAFRVPSTENCRWVEMRQPQGSRRDMSLRLCIAPVDVRAVLRESLHDRMRSEVMTSATLTVDNSFDFFHERTGIPNMESTGSREEKIEKDEDGLPIRYVEPLVARSCERIKLDAPFDYNEQVYFAVPTDLPDPRERDFDEALADLVNRSVAVTGGRAFVLFTSYSQLSRVADICTPFISRMGIDVLRQGREGRDTLLRRFRDDETSVLFATSSFWEGVDVKGRALELLIIARLPFAVPNDPIQEAQIEALRAQGRDPFNNLVVPRAVIRFKQGFGRLIRSRRDKGAVIIADRRVVKMGYGRRFLRSLPDIDVRQGDTSRLMDGMREFFSSHGEPAEPAWSPPNGELDDVPF